VCDVSWIRESAFGTWFLGTETWRRSVLKVAFDDLLTLLGTTRERFPAILDAGSGFGKALPLLDERFHPERIVALDVDPRMRVRASQEARRCRSTVHLEVGSLERIEQPDASFDLVFCHQTLHHIADQESALREFHRVLKKDGVLLLAESCKRFIDSLLIRILFRHPMEAQRTAGEYIELMRAAGFTIDPSRISTPNLWWSRPDVGALEWLGFEAPSDRGDTLLNLAAFKSG